MSEGIACHEVETPVETLLQFHAGRVAIALVGVADIDNLAERLVV